MFPMSFQPQIISHYDKAKRELENVIYQEGKGYQPAPGYEWVNSSPDDLRVKRELKGASKKNLEQTLNKDSPDHYRK